MATKEDLSPLALALGRIPTGLFVVTCQDGKHALGFVASFLVQVGFEPPTVCVAIGRDRSHLGAIRASGHFCVSILDAQSADVMGAFFKPRPEGESAFDHVEHTPAPSGAARISTALAWLDCRVSGEHDVGDHVVVFGTVEAAGLEHEADPTVHLRTNGLGY